MADIHQLPTSAANARQPGIDQTQGPVNVEIESGLLGCLMAPWSPLQAVIGILKPEHFSEQVHAQTYRVLVEMAQAGRPITLAALRTYIPATDLAPGLTLAAYLARCIADSCVPLHAEAYAVELIDLYARRQMVAVAGEMTANAMDAPVGQRFDEMIGRAEAALLEVRQSVGERGKTHGLAGQAALEVIEFLHMARDGFVEPTGIKTGLHKVDMATGGIQPGDMWIVGGRPGQGKTVLGTNIARGVAGGDMAAWRQDQSVVRRGAAFFSFEVNKRQLTARLLSDMAYLRSSPFQNQITFGDILRGRVKDENHLWRVEDAAKRLGEMPLAIDWSARLTVPQIAARIRAEKVRMRRAGCDLGVVVLDYLKFIQASDRYRGQRAQEVAEISGGLKQVAKDEGVGVVLLAQLNRQNEMRGDPTPVLSDLKESGDLEADADVVLFVHRPEYYIGQTKAYKDQQPDAVERFNNARGKMEAILAKNRAGSTRTLNLFSDVGCSMVDDHDRRAMPSGNYMPDPEMSGL